MSRSYAPKVCQDLTRHPHFRYRPGMPLEFHGFRHYLLRVEGTARRPELWWCGDSLDDSDNETPWVRDGDGWAQRVGGELWNPSGGVWPVLDCRDPAAWGFVVREAARLGLDDYAISDGAKCQRVMRRILLAWGPR